MKSDELRVEKLQLRLNHLDAELREINRQAKLSKERSKKIAKLKREILAEIKSLSG